MRFLNMNQLADIPDADPALTHRAEQTQRRQYDARMKQELAAQARRQAQADRASLEREAMLKRSLRNTGHNVLRARAFQGSGQVPQYGVVNPHLGFVEEVPASFKDFSMQTAQNAVEFKNQLSAKDVGYTQFFDYPLVLDSKGGDFSGILTDEAHSADFSMRIVDDVRQDFGYTPRHTRRRRR